MDAKEYEEDFDYSQANRNDLCRKHKNEFVVVRNLKVYHDANPLKPTGTEKGRWCC